MAHYGGEMSYQGTPEKQCYYARNSQNEKTGCPRNFKPYDECGNGGYLCKGSGHHKPQPKPQKYPVNPSVEQTCKQYSDMDCATLRTYRATKRCKACEHVNPSCESLYGYPYVACAGLNDSGLVKCSEFNPEPKVGSCVPVPNVSTKMEDDRSMSYDTGGPCEVNITITVNGADGVSIGQ